MNKQIQESELLEAVEIFVASIRANKHSGLHGTQEDREYFESILNAVLQDLENAIAKIIGES